MVENSYDGKDAPEPQQREQRRYPILKHIHRMTGVARKIFRKSRETNDIETEGPETILSEDMLRENQKRQELSQRHPLGEHAFPLSEPIEITPRLEKVFGRERIEQTNSNAPTFKDIQGFVTAFEEIVNNRRERYLNLEKRDIAPEEPFSSNRDGIPHNDYKNYVRKRFFPYENPRAYEEAPYDSQGRPYLATIENLMMEMDEHGNVTAREHFYLDRDYTPYISRTIYETGGQEITEIIPASYEDLAYAMDAIHNKTIGVNGVSEESVRQATTEKNLERLIAEDFINQYKSTLNERPEFIQAVIEQYVTSPFDKITEEVKQKALKAFWVGSGRGVRFFLNNRLVEVAYLRDLDTQRGKPNPDTPGGYEKINVALYPTKNARIMQDILISTDFNMSGISSLGNIIYEERQPKGQTRIASSSGSREGSKEQALKGAEEIYYLLAKRKTAESVFGFETKGDTTIDEETFYLLDTPPILRISEDTISEDKLHKQQRYPDLSSLGVKPTEKKVDKTLDSAFDPQLIAEKIEDPK